MPALMESIRLKQLGVADLILLISGISFLTMALGTTPPVIGGVLAAAVWIFSGRALTTIPQFFAERWFWPVLLLLLLPWIGLLYSPDVRGLGWDYAGKTHYWLYGLALAALPRLHPPARFAVELLLHAFLLGLAFNALVGFLQFAGWVPPQNGWYSGLGRGYSTLSAYLIIGILLTSFYFRQLRGRLRLLALALMIIYFLHLILLEGRTGYVTFAVVSPLIAWQLLPRQNWPALVLVCTVLVVGMLFSPVVQQRLALTWEQLSYHHRENPDVAWGRAYTVHQDRFYMWMGAWRVFRTSPWIGVGTGGYATTLYSLDEGQAPFIAHPHNDFLYMAANYGLVGMAAFIWFFAVVLQRAWASRDTAVGYFTLASTLVVLISGLFNAQILDAGMAYLVAVIVGLQRNIHVAL